MLQPLNEGKGVGGVFQRTYLRRSFSLVMVFTFWLKDLI